MAACSPMRVLPLLCLLSATSWAFVLRDRAQEEDSVERLVDALKVIEQERQRLQQQEEEEEEVRDFGGPLPYSWRGGEGFESNAVPEDLLQELLAGEEQLPADEVPEPLRSSKAANLDEVQDILEPSEYEKKRSENKRVVMKKSIPRALGGPSVKREYDPSSEKKKKAAETTELDSTPLTEDEVNKLLSAADETEEEALENNDEAQEVSQEEMEKVLEEDEGDDRLPAEEVSLQPASEDEWPENPSFPVNINKELLLSQYLQDSTPRDLTKKKKRSGEKRSSNFDNGSDEVSVAREYIKKFLDLEDDENTNLANALNLATLAQVQRTDKFIQAEVQFLRKAIADEEAIQELKSDVEGPEAEEIEEEEEEEEEGLPLARKRSDPVDEDIPEVDIPLLEEEPEIVDNDVIEDEDLDAAEEFSNLSEEDKEAFSHFLQQKLQQYLMRSAPSPWENEISPTYEDSMGTWYNGPVDFNQEGITEEEWQVNPFYRALLKQYRSGDVDKRGYDDEEEDSNDIYEPEEEDEDVDQEAEEEIEDALSNYISQISTPEGQFSEEDVCPAMDMLDDCEFARSLGLRLDGEAMDLCNRHQLCYLCGGAHGLSSDDCDNGYLEEADRLCDREGDDCKDDAAGLYLLMLKGHGYVEAEDTADVCSTICTTDFIYGLTKK